MYFGNNFVTKLFEKYAVVYMEKYCFEWLELVKKLLSVNCKYMSIF